MAVKYFHLAEALYYRILESIIERENYDYLAGRIQGVLFVSG